MGHSSGLRHVLPSGWKRKWLGPITASFLSLSISPSPHLISWWDVPLCLAFSLIQRLLLWPRFYLKNSWPGGEKELDWSSVDSFLLCSSGASRFLHTQTWSTSLRSEKDEATVSHIVGRRARFAFQLHLRWNHFRRERKVIGNVERCSCQELLYIKTSVRYIDGSQPLTHNRIGWTDGYLPSATAFIFLWMDCKRTVVQQC